MRDKRHFLFLLTLHILSLTFIGLFTARAEDSTVLPLCQDLIRERERQMNLSPVSEDAIRDLLHCNGELAELFNPIIVLEEDVNVEDFECGFFDLGCGLYSGIAWDYFSYWAGEDSYIKQIKERLKEDEIDRLATYTKVFPEVLPEDFAKQGVDGLIALAYQKFEKENSWSLNGFDGIKAVVEDFSFHFIRSELIGFGFSAQSPTDVSLMNEEGKKYQDSLKKCFSKARFIQGVDLCIDLMKTYGSYGMGQYVLEKTLESHFLNQISDNKKSEFVREIDSHLHSCLPQYFFNPKEEGAAFEKMRSCVYYTLLHGFRWVITDAVSENLKLDRNSTEVEAKVNSALSQCEVGSWLDQRKEKVQIYREVLEVKAEEFEPKLLECQQKVQDQIVGEVIQSTLLREKLIVDFYGDRIQNFTDKISQVHYPRCLQLLEEKGLKPTAQNCENYLFVQSVFQFFDDLLAQEIEKQIQKILGEGDHQDRMNPVLESAQVAFSQCRLELADQTLSDSSKKRDQWEPEIVKCLNRAMVVVSQELVKLVIPAELAGNSFLNKYSVNLGRNQIQQLAQDFGQCIGGGLNEVQRLLDYTSVLDSLQGQCELRVYKKVILVVMDQILESELLGAGLSYKEFSQLLEDYKEDPKGLYAMVNNVESQEELAELTEKADRIVLGDLAPHLIDRMIEKEAGEYLGPKTQSRIVKLVSDHFLKCSETQTIAACQDQVMPLAIESILYNVLPAEVEKEFEKASIHFITPAVINRLAVRQVVRDSFETPTGRMLIQFIVEQVIQGHGIGELTGSTSQPNTFRQLLFQVFANNRTFMAAMLEAIVQPQINADRDRREKQSPFHWIAVNVFVHQEIFVWRNIKDMPSGREVQRRFERIFERLITQPNAPIRRSEMQEMAKLVGDAAMELNRSLNRRNNNRSQNRNSDR